MNSIKYESFSEEKETIRSSISAFYDIQKTRIGIGNRLVSTFYSQLGMKATTKDAESPHSKDDLDKDSKALISKLEKEYKKITDAIASKGTTPKKALKALSGKNELNFIKSESNYMLVKSYILLQESENTQVKLLEKFVKSHPMWDAFFSNVKGCGPLMSAVCLAYLDPYKAKYVSSFYRYAGLDTVRDMDKNGNNIYITNDGKFNKVIEKYHFEDDSYNRVFSKNKEDTGNFDESRQSNVFINKDTGEFIYKVYDFTEDNEPIYIYIDDKELKGQTYVGDVFISEHGRRMGDTIMQEYTDKNGNVQLKRGLSYNPTLKTKLMGVLAGCLIKAKDPVYSAIYYDYKSRLEKNPKHENKTPGQRNAMAQRYMIKQFLRNLWVTWRELEGLEVVEPYEVAKLGNKPHKYNEYQCMVAKAQRERKIQGI